MSTPSWWRLPASREAPNKPRIAVRARADHGKRQRAAELQREAISARRRRRRSARARDTSHRSAGASRDSWRWAVAPRGADAGLARARRSRGTLRRRCAGSRLPTGSRTSVSSSVWPANPSKANAAGTASAPASARLRERHLDRRRSTERSARGREPTLAWRRLGCARAADSRWGLLAEGSAAPSPCRATKRRSADAAKTHRRHDAFITRAPARAPRSEAAHTASRTPRPPSTSRPACSLHPTRYPRARDRAAARASPV